MSGKMLPSHMFTCTTTLLKIINQYSTLRAMVYFHNGGTAVLLEGSRYGVRVADSEHGLSMIDRSFALLSK